MKWKIIYGDDIMTNQTKSKMKYNRSKYKRYEFNVDIDTELNYFLEYYMAQSSVSYLVKTLLCDYFKINIDDIWCPYYFGHGENGESIKIPNQLNFNMECIIDGSNNNK
jgi:hypothetical protein